MTQQTGQPPEQKFRAGTITAAIWRRVDIEDGREVTRFSTEITKSYKNKEGTWKETTTFFPQDLPKLSLVAQKAFEYISLKETRDESAEAA